MDTLTVTQADDALFSIMDTLERCLIPFYVLDETAKALKDNEHIPSVTVGFEERNFNDANRLTFKQFTTNLKETPQGYTCEHNGVPITVKVFKNKIKYFEHPDLTMYKFEPFNLPNPFKEYWQRRGILK